MIKLYHCRYCRNCLLCHVCEWIYCPAQCQFAQTTHSWVASWLCCCLSSTARKHKYWLYTYTDASEWSSHLLVNAVTNLSPSTSNSITNHLRVFVKLALSNAVHVAHKYTHGQVELLWFFEKREASHFRSPYRFWPPCFLNLVYKFLLQGNIFFCVSLSELFLHVYILMPVGCFRQSKQFCAFGSSLIVYIGI